MLSFFEYYFQDADFGQTETQVLCPYPHKSESGFEYYESNPSAGVNIDKGVFHCLRCGASKSEVGFIKDQLGCSYEQAVQIKRVFETSLEDIHNWSKLTELPDNIRDQAKEFGMTDEVINELTIRSHDFKSISFPVTLYGKIMDVRDYNPGSKPKVKSRYGAMSGLIIPFDLWKNTPESKWTLICAGEKDMAVARSQGFNAITITGGEGVTPLLINEFKGRKVAICYDNDDAGIQGARRLAAVLRPYTNAIKVVDGFHEQCTERGEDLTDFFMKYGGTATDLKNYIVSAPDFSEEDADKETEKMYPTISLFEASSPGRIGKTVRSNIQVVATFESSFSIPTSIEATKMAQPEDKEKMAYGEKKTWDLSERTLKDVLHLMDNNFRETDIAKNINSALLKIPSKEKNVKVVKLSKETIFKCSVTDLFESTSKDTTAMEHTAYVIGQKLESGKKYKATYQVVPHPYSGQQLIMLIMNVDTAADTVSSFQINEEVIKNLQVVQHLPGTVDDKIQVLTDKVKGIVGFDANDTLIQAIDLSYHTVLEFNFGNKFKRVRGYLDTLVVSESRVGKSSTAEALQKTYNLGVIASLAGNSATKAGLIGGSNKVAGGSHQTRAGLIPQNHRNLVIFEELAKCKTDILGELTDVRSSNEVRIVRVNGSLYLPALVRMITLSNVKTHTGMPRSISSYPNGISVIMDLIGTAEDIARYDMMLVLATPGNRVMDFHWEPETPFDDVVYQTKIRWVWSREPEQVVIHNDVLEYIVQKCNELNEDYDSHIKIFGTEAWKKVSRLSIAVAGYIVSTDETYENIIVTKECVDYAVKYFRKIYDNPTFKLKEYVERERQFSEIDEEGVLLLEKLFVMNASLLNQLEQSSQSSRPELMAATGLTNDEFNRVMNAMIKGMYVRHYGQNIMATERFRKGMALIDRNSTHALVGNI